MKNRFILAGVFVAALGATSRAEDCPNCQPKKECKPHEEADDAAIKEAQTRMKEKDLMLRREAVDRLVEAASKHLNCRSKKITGEMARLLADPEASVKSYAAEKLGEFGDDTVSVPALNKEAMAVEKKIPVQMPDPEKAEETRKFEADLSMLNSIYAGLGKSKSPAAAPIFDRGLHHASSFVIEIAAKNCKPLKGNKLVIKGLIEQLAKFFSSPVNKGNSGAWTAISQALPEITGCNDIPTQKDGVDAARWNSAWQKWWRENDKKLK